MNKLKHVHALISCRKIECIQKTIAFVQETPKLDTIKQKSSCGLLTLAEYQGFTYVHVWQGQAATTLI
jgi:hypothetical protein